MPVKVVEGELPYTAGPGIDIDANKVISLLLREENNLIYINDNDEAYVDLQFASGLTPNSDFPVGVTTGKVLQADGWPKSGLVLNRKTTSGDYARWIYAADGTLYLDPGTGTWKQVYYSSDIDAMLAAINARIDAISSASVCGIEIDSINNGVATGYVIEGDLEKGCIAKFVLAGGVSGANVDVIDIDGETFYFLPGRVAQDDMTGIYSEYNGDNYFFMFDGDSSGGTQVQANWNESDSSSPAYIQNKPTIPAAQVNSDWNANSGVAEILNKPTIPSVIDSVQSTSTTDALSANQGKELQDQIDNLQSRGRFLSNWNAATGLPATNPTELPYTYHAGDYFVVTTVSTATPPVNYRPSGSSYNGTASSTTESETLSVGDMYVYDGTNWLLQLNGARTVVVDQALSNSSTNPVENRVITDALSGKQATLVSGTNIKTVNSNSLLGNGDVSINAVPSGGSTGNVLTKTSTGYAWSSPASQVSDTAYASSWNGVTGTAPSQNAVYDKISAMDTTIAGKQDALVSGTSIKTINSTSLLGSGDITIAEFKAASGGVKIFDMPSVNGSMDAIIQWFTGGGDVILREITSGVEYYYLISNWDGTNRTMAVKNITGTTITTKGISYTAAGICDNITTTTEYTFAPSNAGSTGNVLTKTAAGYEWAAGGGGGGDVQVSSQANNILTSGMKIWAGTEANYTSLTKDSNTLYLTF